MKKSSHVGKSLWLVRVKNRYDAQVGLYFVGGKAEQAMKKALKVAPQHILGRGPYVSFVEYLGTVDG